MAETVIDIIGWLGAIFVLYAYLMVSTKKLEGNSLHYQIANISGALFLVINTYYHNAYPSTAVNIIWIGIALYSLASKKKTIV
jgi:hypothetical protein